MGSFFEYYMDYAVISVKVCATRGCNPLFKKIFIACSNKNNTLTRQLRNPLILLGSRMSGKYARHPSNFNIHVALNLIQGRTGVRFCDPESSSGRRNFSKP